MCRLSIQLLGYGKLNSLIKSANVDLRARRGVYSEYTPEHRPAAREEPAIPQDILFSEPKLESERQLPCMAPCFRIVVVNEMRLWKETTSRSSAISYWFNESLFDLCRKETVGCVRPSARLSPLSTILQRVH